MSASYRSVATALAVAVFSFLTIPAATIPASASGSVVPFNGDVSPGTIVVRTNERRLYLVLGQGRAMAYPVGVGRGRSPVVGPREHRRQTHSSGMDAATRHGARDGKVRGHPRRRRTRWVSRR